MQLPVQQKYKADMTSRLPAHGPEVQEKGKTPIYSLVPMVKSLYDVLSGMWNKLYRGLLTVEVAS